MSVSSAVAPKSLANFCAVRWRRMASQGSAWHFNCDFPHSTRKFLFVTKSGQTLNSWLAGGGGACKVPARLPSQPIQDSLPVVVSAYVQTQACTEESTGIHWLEGSLTAPRVPSSEEAGSMHARVQVTPG